MASPGLIMTGGRRRRTMRRSVGKEEENPLDAYQEKEENQQAKHVEEDQEKEVKPPLWIRVENK